MSNPEVVAQRGLNRIQIDGEGDGEFFLDKDGNIYNLKGEFYGTIDE